MDTSNQITFIIPNRGGEHIDFVIDKLREFYPNSEYIVITQDDDKSFMRGQLWNIAYNYVNTDYMCFIDNDMFFPKYIDLIQIYNDLHCAALQPFKEIQQISITPNNEITKISIAPKHPFGKGGVTFISRKTFEKVGGMSNLYVGYGCEDVDFNYRCGEIVDIDEVIYHIQHPKRRTDNDHMTVNVKIAHSREEREIKKDTYNDTIYVLIKNELINMVRYLNVKDIFVVDNFYYLDLLKLHK